MALTNVSNQPGLSYNTMFNGGLVGNNLPQNVTFGGPSRNALNYNQAINSGGLRFNGPTPTVTTRNTTYQPPAAPAPAPTPVTSGTGNSEIDQVWDGNTGMMRKVGDMQREVEARQNAIRGNIDSGFNQYTNELTNIENSYPAYQAADENLVNSTYGTITSGLQQGKQAAMDKLGIARNRVAETGKRSGSDLAQNLRNMLRSGSLQLGAAGAGDSSAANVMMPYAYSKVAAHEQGNIQRNMNDQNLSLDEKGIDTETAFSAELASAEQWKQGAIQGIRDKFLPQIQQIRMMKANAPLQKVQSLNALEENILSNVRSQVNQIDAEVRGFRQNLDMAARQYAGNVQDRGMQLGAAAQYNPYDINFNPMQAMSDPRSRNEYVYQAPTLAKKKLGYGL